MGFNTTLELHGPELGIFNMGSRDTSNLYQFPPILSCLVIHFLCALKYTPFKRVDVLVLPSRLNLNRFVYSCLIFKIFKENYLPLKSKRLLNPTTIARCLTFLSGCERQFRTKLYPREPKTSLSIQVRKYLYLLKHWGLTKHAKN